jgi:hypothetical protein
VPNALIEVTPGSLTTTTGSDGSYSLYGVAPDAEFRITAYGYAPYKQQPGFAGPGPHLRQDFRLVSSVSPPSLAGNFTLAIDVIDACPSDKPLPTSLRHRAYDAVVTQSGLTLQVFLPQPRFSIDAGNGNRFGGRVNDSGATFELGPATVIVERLPDGTLLFIGGSAVTTGSASSLTGTLDGYIENRDQRSFWDADTVWFGGCSGRLAFRLTPR